MITGGTSVRLSLVDNCDCKTDFILSDQSNAFFPPTSSVHFSEFPSKSLA